MAFLDWFSKEERAAFLLAATPVHLMRGQYLLRRGEPGGDVYLVTTGSLEVVDSRAHPEVILASLQSGTVVGEMAFVDNAPRSADVRATSDIEVLRWTRPDLQTLLKQNPSLARTFYETVSRLAIRRIRDLTQNAMAGTLNPSSGNLPEVGRVRADADLIAARAREGLRQAEVRLRIDPADESAANEVRRTLDTLQRDIHDLLTSYPDAEAGKLTTEIVDRELHPYLVRSQLAAQCLLRPQGVTATSELLSLVLKNLPDGDGPLGTFIDQWMLSRPMFAALRTLTPAVVQVTSELLPPLPDRRICLLNAGSGALASSLVNLLGQTPTTLTIIDARRDTLQHLRQSTALSPKLRLHLVQENLARLAMGRNREKLPPQDMILVHGLLEYMPDRIAIALLTAVQRMLIPDGAVVLTALEPSEDQLLIDRLLDWPTIRRSRAGLIQLAKRAHLNIWSEPEVNSPAILLTARRWNPQVRPSAVLTGPCMSTDDTLPA